MQKTISLTKLLKLLAIVATLSASSVYAASLENAEEALKAAIDANNKVAEMGFEWRDTRKALLDPAQKAIKAGNYDKAIELANTALSHAESGMKQAQLAEKASAQPFAKSSKN